MFSPSDTIVAIATPPGAGGLGVVRISGTAAADIAGALVTRRAPLAARRATFTRVVHKGSGTAIDQVVVTHFPAPASYTGEDVIEISAHGSPLLLRDIVAAAIHHGARLAEPGEFTLRAFLNGRLDLPQAEAVADLVEAVTPLQARAAFDQLEGTLTQQIAAIENALFDLMARFEASLDFPDEGYHFIVPAEAACELERIRASVQALLHAAPQGRLIREGLHVAVLGKPNVGKSSLFNCLAGANRAIVSSVPGTTRDLLTDVADVGGFKITLIDTAGIRVTSDEVESEGVARAERAREVADLNLVLLDRSRPLEAVDRGLLASTAGGRRLVVVNKIDLPARWETQSIELSEPVLEISLKTSEGAEDLVPGLIDRLCCGEALRDRAIVTNLRHIELLGRVERSLAAALEGIHASQGALSEEFILADLQEARDALDEITGKRTNEELLRHIFSRFCIGK